MFVTGFIAGVASAVGVYVLLRIVAFVAFHLCVSRHVGRAMSKVPYDSGFSG
jgi:hypothetical protein